jgi:hypothetical protein
MRAPTRRERQMEFLARIERERFKQLQRATGAYQGRGAKPNDNQMLDAYHIWYAEAAEADYFLTLDHKLLRSIQRHRSFPPKVTCLSPSGLFKALEKSGVYSWRDLMRYLPTYAQQVRHPRTAHPLEELVEWTRVLGRAEQPRWWTRWSRLPFRRRRRSQ